MILIIGGEAQGKRAFAEEKWAQSLNISEKIKDRGGISWVKGGLASWETFLQGAYVCEFHLFIRRLLAADPSLHAPAGIQGGRKRKSGCCLPDRHGLVSKLLAACPDRVLVTNEIGYGIVPLDPFEREYREETGRICCLLAAEAKEVWRASCGLGQRIK